MTRFELIAELENLNEKLLREVDLELHDLAREKAFNFIFEAILCLNDNSCDERG